MARVIPGGSDPPRRCGCVRRHRRLELVEARDAVGFELRIGDRAALLADPSLTKSAIRFHEAVVPLGFHHVSLGIPV
jgi:hypothetical protein